MRRGHATGLLAVCWVVAASTLVVACGWEAVPTPPDPVVPAAVEADEARLSYRVRREGRSLILTLDDGGEVTFRDVPAEGDAYRRFRFKGTLDDLPYFIVETMYHEGGEYRLVHQGTGSVTRVDGLPVVSPDRRRFVTASMDLHAEYDPNRIQIFRADGDTLHLEWELEPPDLAWGPSDPRWIDDRTILFVKMTPDYSDGIRYDRSSSCQRLVAGTWLVEEACGEVIPGS